MPPSLSFVRTVRPGTLAALEAVSRPDVALLPRLAHNLERVVQRPGVHFQQNPITREYRFLPHLSRIPLFRNTPAAVNQYVPPGQDAKLLAFTQQHRQFEYYSSTSLVTTVLAQLHALLSNNKPLDIHNLDPGALGPAGLGRWIHHGALVLVLEQKNETGTVYAIQKELATDLPRLLSEFGIGMEKMLTYPQQAFETMLGTGVDTFAPPEVHNYAGFGPFLLRAQLDCYHPERGVFDIKTRAALPLRYDGWYWEEATRRGDAVGYQISRRHGWTGLFAREYYDMARLAMIKYGLQARIGAMDGAFVAYHNTQETFGYQYLPLTEMDAVVHGWGEKRSALAVADEELRVSLEVWHRHILAPLTARFGGLYWLMMRTPRRASAGMEVCAVPLSPEDAHAIQNPEPVTPEMTLAAKWEVGRRQQARMAALRERVSHEAVGMTVTARQDGEGYVVAGHESTPKMSRHQFRTIGLGIDRSHMPAHLLEVELGDRDEWVQLMRRAAREGAERAVQTRAQDAARRVEWERRHGAATRSADRDIRRA